MQTPERDTTIFSVSLLTFRFLQATLSDALTAMVVSSAD